MKWIVFDVDFNLRRKRSFASVAPQTCRSLLIFSISLSTPLTTCIPVQMQNDQAWPHRDLNTHIYPIKTSLENLTKENSFYFPLIKERKIIYTILLK